MGFKPSKELLELDEKVNRLEYAVDEAKRQRKHRMLIEKADYFGVEFGVTVIRKGVYSTLYLVADWVEQTHRTGRVVHNLVLQRFNQDGTLGRTFTQLYNPEELKIVGKYINNKVEQK